MDECVEHRKLINKYYTNLDYSMNINKLKILHKLFRFCSEVHIPDANNFANRLSVAASIMQNNFDVFVSICEHKDTVTSIIDYLTYFSMQITHERKGEFSGIYEIMQSLIFTIYNINFDVQFMIFLDRVLIEHSYIFSDIKRITHIDYKQQILKQNIEMILLEESDLYAVTYYLKIKHIVSTLKIIWVQESIKEAFKWHIKKYLTHFNIPICIFQSKQDLLTLENISIFSEIKILSIWSEDIVGARNLAMSFKRHVIFINTHMNFCVGILLPYTNLCKPQFDFISADETNAKYVKLKTVDSCPYYNLFYNGMWQKPVNNMYYMHNDIFLANGTSEDFNKCIDSATQGFKIWNALSSSNRMYRLSRLASILECQDESLLANIVSKWIKFSYYCVNQIIRHETEQFEITKIRESRGIIILEEKERIIMFRELTQSLITGNSVIVICNPDICTLTHYCDMFSTAMIPPGTINLFSSNTLVDVKYNNLADLSPEAVHANLTINKHIVICLK